MEARQGGADGLAEMRGPFPAPARVLPMPMSKSEAGKKGAAVVANTRETRNVAMLSARNEELALRIVVLEREIAAAEQWKRQMAERIVQLEQAGQRLRRRG